MNEKEAVLQGLIVKKRASNKALLLDDEELLKDAMKNALKHQIRQKNGILHSND